MKLTKKSLFIVLFVLTGATGTLRASDAIGSIPVKFDHRGLVQIDGILRQNSKSNWGASNLILKPYGGWAAQDYCLKGIKKQNGVFTADFNTKPQMIMVETTKKVKWEDGTEALQVNYELSPKDGKQASFEEVYVSFPFASDDFVGGKITPEGGGAINLPAEPNGDIAIHGNPKSITITNGKVNFILKAEGMSFKVKDLRPKNTAFQLCLQYPDPQKKTNINFTFEVAATGVPFTIKADGKNWIKLPYSNEIVPGSILDFSFLNDAPAGKYGRIINKDGHFTYAKTGKRIKLVGTNLCYDANYIEKEEADRIAQHFVKMGYNSIRFHHTDVHIRKGNWNSKISDDIDEEWLDRLDYMFYTMKEHGMYITIDLYTQRTFGAGEIEGINKPICGEIKGLIPVHEPAFKAWQKLVVKWMNHVNPYTGIAWKDDPALISICPVNEDSIASTWWSAKDMYLKRFAQWKAERNLKSSANDVKNDPLFAQFLTEIKMESNKKVEKFLKDTGIKAMISGSNWWNTMAQTFTRDQFDVVDNHEYSDHPQPWYLPAKYNQQSNLRNGNATYITPIMMASTRIFGKPFTVTEYNYCMPNKSRAEGGALMGAYASLQDWDGLYRFAWSHTAKRVNKILSMHGFDLSSDPLNQLSERQIILMFGRGDVKAGENKHIYGVTMKEATAKGLGDMWSNGLFPHNFNALAQISQIGSEVITDSKGITGKYAQVVMSSPIIDKSKLGGNPVIETNKLPSTSKPVVSDTGEISMDTSKGFIKVDTPKTSCIATTAPAELNTSVLSIKGNKDFCSVSASAMDNNNLQASKRILLLHLTNVLSDGMQFSNERMTVLLKQGELPHIVRSGIVELSLKNSNSKMKLYACDFSGKRVKGITASYADGSYKFNLNITADTPYMIYELSAK